MVGRQCGPRSEASVRWLDANFVVHSFANPLLAAKISFSRLNGNVPKQKLDLLEFASGRVPKPRATKVVGR
jgi:hypothetical protein